MLKNHLKLALRRIQKQKLHSFINIGGLALGIACFLIMSAYVIRELSYDDFHRDKDNIYRVCRIEKEPSGMIFSAATPHALAKALKNDYPVLKNVVSVISGFEDEINSGENKFQGKITFASPEFFKMFDIKFGDGSPEQLSRNINSIILSKPLALKLFGSLPPIGKTVTIDGQFQFIVAGVTAEIPSNSSFQFDAFISNEAAYRYMLPGEEKKWYSMGVETFVEFSPKISPEYLKAQFPSFLNKYLPDFLKGRIELDLQPLGEIHTNTNITSYAFPAVSKTALFVFFIIACTILFIAVTNFVNIAAARLSEYRNEIGVRRVVGAGRRQIIQQLLSESILMTFCALIAGYLIVWIALPYFNGHIKNPLKFSLFTSPSFLAFGLLFGLMLGIITGLYPALLLSRAGPAKILYKEDGRIFGFVRLRHFMITIQFGITIALIFCVICVYMQISFMKNYNLGFLSENLISIPTNTHPVENADVRKVNLFTDIIRNEGRSHGIESATFSENAPGTHFPNQFGVIPEGGSDENRLEMITTRNVDDQFFNTYRMKIALGRGFSKSMATDLSQAAVINETAAEMFGWNDPIGKQFRFSFDRQLFTVIGVVSDFHFRSLQNKIEPLIFIQCWGMSNYVTARIRSDDIQSSVAYLRQEWNKIMPSFPFIYHFVKDMYSESYKEEEKLLNLISVFAVLAIVLASLGLLGLTAIITVSRTKEIGIRKTLGASVSGIVFLISKELLLWVILANTIALPAAVYFIRGWLRDYPYRIDLSWWLFFMSGGLAFFIAVFMMAFQTIKVAIANPVEALRYE